MTREASTKKAIAFSSRPKQPITIGRIDGPIRSNAITTHGKPAWIIPAPIARYYGFHNNWDWLAFDATIVQGGILLSIKNRYTDNESRESEAGAALILATPRPNGELLPSSKTGLAISVVNCSDLSSIRE